MRTRLSFLILICLQLLVACSGKQLPRDQILERQGDPGLRTLSGPGVFVGVSHQHSSLADARSEALRNARAEIILSLESRLSHSLVDSMVTRGSSDNILSSDAFTNSRLQCLANNVIAVKADAYYIERHQLREPDGLRYYYLAWCAVRYEREQHMALLEQQVQRYESQVTRSLPQEIWPRLRELLARQRGIGSLREAYGGFSPAQAGRLDVLQSQLHRELDRIELGVSLQSEGALPGLDVRQIQRRLAGELGHLLPMKVSESNRAPLLLVGRIRPSVQDRNGMFCQAQLEMNLSLQHPASGRTLWSFRRPYNSQADTPERACSFLLADGGELDEMYKDVAGELLGKLGLSIQP